MEDNTTYSFEIRRYIALVWRWTWLLILTTALAGGAAYYITSRQTPVYEASALAMIDVAPLSQVNNYNSLYTNERLSETYSQMMITRPVLEDLAEAMGLDTSYAVTLQGRIRVEPVEGTSILEVYVTDTDPELAAYIANKLVTVFAAQVREDQESRYAASKVSLEEQMAEIDVQIQSINDQLALLEDVPENQVARDELKYQLSQYRQTYANLLYSYEEIRLAEAQSISTIALKESALPPTSPIRPQVMRSTMLGAVVGLMVGAGLAYLFELLDDSVLDPQEVTRRFGLPVLGMIASHNPTNGDLITQTHPSSPTAEAFRGLRTNLQYASVDYPLRTILITSPSPEDGKSTVAANLSVVLANSGRRVALVDADLRRPVQHKHFRLANRRGLSELFLTPEAPLDGHLKKTEVEFLSALSAGKPPPNPSELLGSDAMSNILSQVSQRADVVVIDSPPVMAVTDALVLASRVDGVLLVVKPTLTKLPAIQQSIAQLRQVGANILGVVLNDVEIKHRGYRNYYYYNAYHKTYHKHYTESDKKAKKKERQKSGS